MIVRDSVTTYPLLRLLISFLEKQDILELKGPYRSSTKVSSSTNEEIAICETPSFKVLDSFFPLNLYQLNKNIFFISFSLNKLNHFNLSLSEEMRLLCNLFPLLSSYYAPDYFGQTLGSIVHL